MKHEPVAIKWNNRLYYKKGYFEYLCDNFINEMGIVEEVEDIFDVSESDGNTFYISGKEDFVPDLDKLKWNQIQIQ
jgi:hypothetical protein